MRLNLHRLGRLLVCLALATSCNKTNTPSGTPLPPGPPPTPVPIPAPVALASCDNSNRPKVPARLTFVGNLSEPRIGMATVAAGHRIVFAGASLSKGNNYGSPWVDIYDPTTGAWSSVELSETKADIAVAAAGNKVFLAGGRQGDGAFDELFSTVDIYDVATGDWTVTQLSVPRAYLAAAAVGNKVLFAGGEKDWEYNTSSTVDIYDLATGTWSTAQLSEPRAFLSAVVVKDKVYFAGGQKEDRWYNEPSSAIDIYDAATNTWSVASLQSSMGFLTGVALSDRIYWAAGCSVEIQDVAAGSSTGAFLFGPGDWVGDQGQKAVVKDNKIIFFHHASTGNTQFDIYDPATNTWSIGQLSVNIAGASIVSVDNTVYLAGGLVNGAMSDEVWRLDF